jgi:hypothetical protein
MRFTFRKFRRVSSEFYSTTFRPQRPKQRGQAPLPDLFIPGRITNLKKNKSGKGALPPAVGSFHGYAENQKDRQPSVIIPGHTCENSSFTQLLLV